MAIVTVPEPSAAPSIHPAGDGDAVQPKRPGPSRRALWLGGTALVLGGALLVAYVARTALADNLVSRQLADRSIDASYQIETVGLTHQRLTNVRIGDPNQPDVTAREADVWLGYGWEGPRIDRIRLRGVRLFGRHDGERLRFGQLDRLLPAESDAPTELPDLTLDVADAGAVIDTPWGRIAAGAVLNGNPLRGMTGSVAALSPGLNISGCHAIGARLNGNVRSDGVDLHLLGPISAARVMCPDRDASISGLLIDANVSLPVGLETLRWTGDFSVTRATGDGFAANHVAGRSTGRWSLVRGRASGFVSARARELAGAGLAARGGALRGDFAQADGRWRFTGGTALTGVNLPPQWRGLGALMTAQRTAPLMGPILAQFGSAFDAASQNFGVTVPVRADGSADATRITIPSARLTSSTGATARLSNGQRALTWDGRRLVIGGDFLLAGGGFPEVSGTFTRSSEGALALNVAPFRAVADDAALAVARLQLTLDPLGNGRFIAAAGLSGPVGGGRVDGLALPLTGQVLGGRVSIDTGCRALHYDGIVMAGAVFDAGALRLCSLPGRPLLAFGNGPLMGGLSADGLQLRGRSGDSPLHIGLGGLRYDLRGGEAEIRGLSVALGEGASMTQLTADHVTALSGAEGWRGHVFAGTGRIGSVPLAMSGITGPWRWTESSLVLDGDLIVSDTASSARFTPMTISQATLRYAGGRINATGVIGNPATAAPLANLSLNHLFSDGSGEALFALIPIRFATDGVQPQDLTDLARGVVANVDGTVTGNGRIAWTSDGVSSTGQFSTDAANLAAAFGPVTGLSGTITFDDLLGLTTPTGQIVRLASVNPGIEVVDGTVRYQMQRDSRVRIEGGEWPFAGGTLRLLPGLIDYGADQPRYLSFDVEGIDAARFLERYGFENITATGVFDGVIPTVFDGNGGRVVGGSLVVRDGGGSLAYVGELTNHDLGYFGNIAFGALRSIQYDALIIRLNGNIDGEMLTEVGFTGLGQGPEATNNFLTRQIARLPFAFNIRINAPFRQLLTSARSLYDPTVLIDQNLPTLIAAEQAERERQAQQRSGVPVQQQESGNRPQGEPE